MRRFPLMRSLAASVVVLVLLLAAGCGWSPKDQVRRLSPAPTATGWAPGDPVIEPPVKVPEIVGVNYHPLWEAMDADARSRSLNEVVAAGVGWVRIDIGWHNLQPDGPDSYDLNGGVRQIDERISEARRRGLRVLLMFYWAPQWSSGTKKKNGRPKNPQDYANAAAWVADRYSGNLGDDLRVDAIELWNEPDLERFWAPRPAATRVSDFAVLVRVAGRAVKDANANMTVVVGGISVLDVDWLEQFYASDPGVGSSYDVLGLHTYTSPGDSPPDHFDLDHPKHSMLTIAQIVEEMAAHGDPAPIWVTEFGWSTHSNNPLTTEEWARGVTEQQQAEYLLSAMRTLTAQPRVAAAFWYNIWSPPIGDEHMDGFGLLAPDFRRKPSFYAMRCVASGVCGP